MRFFHNYPHNPRTFFISANSHSNVGFCFSGDNPLDIFYIGGSIGI